MDFTSRLKSRVTLKVITAIFSMLLNERGRRADYLAGINQFSQPPIATRFCRSIDIPAVSGLGRPANNCRLTFWMAKDIKSRMYTC